MELSTSRWIEKTKYKALPMISFPRGQTHRQCKKLLSKKSRFSTPIALIPAFLLFIGIMAISTPAQCARQQPKSPLDLPMPAPLPPIPPLEQTSPTKQNQQAKKRINAAVERMREVIRIHREMRGLKPIDKK